MTSTDTLSLDRRVFLTSTGALLVTLAAPADWAEAAANGAAVRPALKGDQLNSYITIDADGTVVGYYGKIDGGQGLGTSIAQMVAEEIEVPFEHVRIVMGDSALTLDMGGASAAIGVSHGGMTLRRTAAHARHLLIEMAAKQLNLPADQLTVTDGVVHAVADPAKRVTYAELIGGRFFDSKVNWNGKTSSQLQVEVKVPLKKPSEFKVIGQSFLRRDLPGKVFGTLEYVNDVRLPGMLHARMIRPTVAGAVPVKVDEASIKDLPGAKVVWIKDLLAVVAEKEWNAVKAAKALKVTWSDSKPNFPGHANLHDHIRKAPVALRKIQRENGSVEEGLKQAVRSHRGRVRIPDPVARQHGPRLCGRRRARARGNALDFDAEALRLGRLCGRTAWHAARQGACDLDVRHRQLRPQRPGRRHRGRSRALETSRQTCARAVHAARATRLGPEGHGLGQPQPRRPRRVRQGDRL